MIKDSHYYKRKIRAYMSILALAVLIVGTTGNSASAFFLELFGNGEGDFAMSGPTIEESGGVTLEIKKYPINRYKAHNEDADKMINGQFNGMANAVMSASHLIVTWVDNALSFLFSIEPIENFSTIITDVSSEIFDVMMEYFGEIFFVFSLLYVTYLYYVKASFKEAFRKFIVMMGILIFGFFFISNSGDMIKSLNTLSVEGQGYFMTAGNSIIETEDESRVFADVENIDENARLDGTIAILRNLYFDLAVKKPYMILNYGTTDERVINEADRPEDLELPPDYNRVDRLLAFDGTELGQQQLEVTIEGEVEAYGNEAMSSSNVWMQLALSFVSIFGALALGLPFFFLAFANLFIEGAVLLFVLILGLTLVLSIIPRFSNSALKIFGTVLSLFFIKCLLGLLVLVIYLTAYMIDSLIPPTNIGMYLLNITSLIALMFILFKYRDKIVSTITAGQVVSVDGNLTKNVNNGLVQPGIQNLNNGVRRVNPFNKPSDVSNHNGSQSSDVKRNYSDNKVRENQLSSVDQNNVERTKQTTDTTDQSIVQSKKDGKGNKKVNDNVIPPTSNVSGERNKQENNKTKVLSGEENNKEVTNKQDQNNNGKENKKNNTNNNVVVKQDETNRNSQVESYENHQKATSKNDSSNSSPRVNDTVQNRTIVNRTQQVQRVQHDNVESMEEYKTKNKESKQERKNNQNPSSKVSNDSYRNERTPQYKSAKEQREDKN